MDLGTAARLRWTRTGWTTWRRLKLWRVSPAMLCRAMPCLAAVLGPRAARLVGVSRAQGAGADMPCCALLCHAVPSSVSAWLCHSPCAAAQVLRCARASLSSLSPAFLLQMWGQGRSRRVPPMVRPSPELRQQGWGWGQALGCCGGRGGTSWGQMGIWGGWGGRSFHTLGPPQAVPVSLPCRAGGPGVPTLWC